MGDDLGEVLRTAGAEGEKGGEEKGVVVDLEMNLGRRGRRGGGEADEGHIVLSSAMQATFDIPRLTYAQRRKLSILDTATLL